MTGGSKNKKSKKSKKSKKGGASLEESMAGMIGGFSDSLEESMTGGSKNKKSKKSKKGGASLEESMAGMIGGFSDSLEESMTGGSKNKKSKKSMKGGMAPLEEVKSEELLNNYAKFNKSGGSKLKKLMKGGMESSGATPMDQRFFNPNAKLDNYPAISGNGIMSAYGPIESGDIGTGMLAPYTASTCKYANVNTTMKTGGSKRQYKKGGGPIPSISDSPIRTVDNTVSSSIDGFAKFMHKLENNYNKSIEYTKSIKIGNQRLIKGGSKSNSKKKTLSKKKVGGDGSDFATTLSSRGPVNAPDDYWGTPGHLWFKQFNKTGDYIPNSKLAVAATPTLAGVGNSDRVSGYDPMGFDNGSA